MSFVSIWLQRNSGSSDSSLENITSQESCQCPVAGPFHVVPAHASVRVPCASFSCILSDLCSSTPPPKHRERRSAARFTRSCRAHSTLSVSLGFGRPREQARDVARCLRGALVCFSPFPPRHRCDRQWHCGPSLSGMIYDTF